MSLPEVSLNGKWFVILVFFVFSPALLAQQSPSSLLDVRFTPLVADPEAPYFIENLSNYAGAALMYVQPAEDGRHLLQSAKPLNEHTLNRLLARLQRHASVDDIQLRINM